MFGLPRHVARLQSHPGPAGLIDWLLAELSRFHAGAGEQKMT